MRCAREHTAVVGRRRARASRLTGSGVELGDPLAAAFFALGQHDSLAAPHARLQPGEVLAAFLDDLYVVTCPARAREACDIVSREVEQSAGGSCQPL